MYIYIYTYVHLSNCIYLSFCLYFDLYLYLYQHIHESINRPIHTHTHIYVYTHKHTHTHMYTYIHTYTYIYRERGDTMRVNSSGTYRSAYRWKQIDRKIYIWVNPNLCDGADLRGWRRWGRTPRPHTHKHTHVDLDLYRGTNFPVILFSSMPLPAPLPTSRAPPDRRTLWPLA